MLNIVWSGTFTKPCGKSNRLENKFPSVCCLLIDLQVPYPSKVDVEMREWGLIRGQNKSNMRSQNYHHSHGTGDTCITCNRSCQPQSLNQHHRPVKDHAGHWRWWVGSVFSEEYNLILFFRPTSEQPLLHVPSTQKLFEKWSDSQNLRSTKMPFQRTDGSYPSDTLRITLQDFGMPSSFTKAIWLSPN